MAVAAFNAIRWTLTFRFLEESILKRRENLLPFTITVAGWDNEIWQAVDEAHCQIKLL